LSFRVLLKVGIPSGAPSLSGCDFPLQLLSSGGLYGNVRFSELTVIAELMKDELVDEDIDPQLLICSILLAKFLKDRCVVSLK